nr:unnamed protein product [Callosobruchus chinensis]
MEVISEDEATVPNCFPTTKVLNLSISYEYPLPQPEYPGMLSIAHFKFLQLASANFTSDAQFSWRRVRNNIEGGKELKCELLNSFLDCFNFVQYNNIVNSNGRLLDLVIANHECIVTRSTPIAREDHHHPALSINLKITQETNSNFEFNNNEVQYNFKRADFLNLYIDFLNIDWNWSNEETDVNALCRRFYEEIFRVIERHVPKFKNFKRRYPKWYTKDIISDIKSKHYFYKKFKKTGDLTYFDHFKLLRSSIKLKKLYYLIYLEFH